MFRRSILYVALWLSAGLLWPNPAGASAQPATRQLDSLRMVVRKAPAGRARIQALLRLSEALAAADSATALGQAQQAYALARRYTPGDTLEAQCLVAVAVAYRNSGQQPKALDAYWQALAVYQKLKQPAEEAFCYRRLGHTYAEISLYQEALAAYQQELRLRRQVGDQQKLVECYANIGLLYYDQYDYPAALRYQTISLRLAEKHHLTKTTAQILSNMSGIYQEQKDLPRAIACVQRALRLHQTSGDAGARAAAIGNLGVMYSNQGKYALAEQHLLECLRFNEKRADWFAAAVMRLNLGNVYARQGNYARALRQQWQAKETFRKKNIPDMLVSTLSDMAGSYQRTQQLALAALYARQAQRLAQQHGLKQGLTRAVSQLAQISAQRNDFAAAYAYQRRYQQLQDSLHSQEKAQKLAELQTRYETQQNQAQLRLLRRNAALQRSEARLQRWVRNGLGTGLVLAVLVSIISYRRYRLLQVKKAELAANNLELTRTQQQLRKSLGEKEVLLKEVHHRVKNNLQIISSLLALQAQEQEGEPPVVAALQEGQSWIRSIALIHEMLYQSDDLSSVGSQELLARLTATLVQHWAPRGAVTYEVAAAGAVLNTSTAVPLGLIVNELIINAITHAFADGRPGHLRLELGTLAPGYHQLTVSDNGPGLPPGFCLERASSLGLRLVNSLAEQLEGSLHIQNTAAGARFLIRFREQAETELPR
ncbi:tetratricopeptide repeat protein [Hymenobacter weizhouensis]|uniref:tetratricopeptide repeat protein n=1 Tax=Hymenobacter sp. YIM 151500-1 TaxID=2987689 RepID=UPI002227B8F4|nr:tetratricopeptide repeat protein [Hymenobacter sp. YIM 151500-1]UYZ63730.1 tetratricopeptide repeat protein [Hymenobacter sp. YIM 151500-1]